MINVYLVNNTDQDVPEDFLSWLVNECASLFPKEVQEMLRPFSQVGVVFVNEDKMTELNQAFRQKSGATDILSFSATEHDDEGQLGELVVCTDVVHRQAADHELKFVEELSYLVVHGLLHLLGYDHEVESEAKAMFSIQDHLFEQLMAQDLKKRFEG